jgi:hypothetical protein
VLEACWKAPLPVPSSVNAGVWAPVATVASDVFALSTMAAVVVDESDVPAPHAERRTAALQQRRVLARTFEARVTIFFMENFPI